METEATKELRTIKDAIAAQYKSFREFFDALLAEQRQTHPEFTAVCQSKRNLERLNESLVVQ